METIATETKAPTAEKGKKRKGGWGNAIFKFLMYGGWLLLLIAFLAVWVLITIVFK
jgi:hypothetical protein